MNYAEPWTFPRIGYTMSTTKSEREAIERQLELNRRSLSRTNAQTAKPLRQAAQRSELVVGQALKRLGYGH